MLASISNSNGAWSSSLIAGWNHKSTNHRDFEGVVAETNFRFNVSNYITGRVEILHKEDFLGTIKALTGGYTKDVYRSRDLLGGVGGNVTVYRASGERPISFYAFLRLRTAAH